MSIASNFPAIKPTLLLDFANTEELDPRITFTRASTATYYGTETAKAEQNLLLQSQDFTTTWSTASQNSTITANTTTAPDGTTTADTLTDNATSGVHRVAQTITTSNNNQLVLSCFLKYSTMQWVSLSAATNTGQWAGAKFDVQNGVLGSTSQQGTSWTADSSSITSVGSGWYRCVLVFTPGNSGSLGVYVNGATDGTTFTTSQRGSEVYSGTGSEVFLWGAQLEQRSAVSAYTPTTTQAITNYIPVLETAASGVARFDHNPTTFESLGLEIEESRTNLFTYSEQFDNAAWTKVNATITANTIVSPDGTLDGDKHVPDSGATIGAGSSETRVYQSPLVTSGTSYTFTIYAKAGEYDQLAMAFITSPTVSAVFSLTLGTVVSGTGATITPVGNGWYRCALTATATSTGALQIRWSAESSTVSTGNGYSGIYIWGAQLEAGAFATSYIPTVASQVTRAADAASMTGTNFSDWYNAAEGTFYAQFIPASSDFGGNKNIFLASDGTTSNFVGLRYGSSGSQPTMAATTSAVSQANVVTGTMVAGTSYKLAGVYEANDFAASRNAGTVGTDTSGTVPVVTQAEIGMLAGTGFGTQTISKLAYYPLRVTNAQLQALTS